MNVTEAAYTFITDNNITEGVSKDHSIFGLYNVASNSMSIVNIRIIIRLVTET